MEKNLTVKDKIFAFLEKKGISKTDFYAETGIESSNFKGKNKESLPGSAMLVKILTKYPDLSADWLLTGQGEMLKQDVPSVATPDADAADGRPTSSDKDTKNNPNNQEKAIPFATALQQNLKPIPLVTQTVAAGFGNENFSIAESDVKEYYVIPKFRYCQVDFMIEVSGDSMMPHLNSGDVVACTVIRDSHFIQWNHVHVIATREQGLLVKRLTPSEDDSCLRAVSDNPKYHPFDIPKDEITGLALVIGSVCLE